MKENKDKTHLTPRLNGFKCMHSLLIIILLNTFKPIKAAPETSMTINDLDFLDFYEPNVYIVDLKNPIHTRGIEFVLTCASGLKALDLNLTFTGLNSKTKGVQRKLINVPGRKQVEMTLQQPLQSAYTGQYNCTALYDDGVVESVSWYIYFYPNDGKKLFLDCPLFGSLRSCLVFYRLKVPFKIPCKTLHPEIKVDERSNSAQVIYLLFII